MESHGQDCELGDYTLNSLCKHATDFVFLILFSSAPTWQGQRPYLSELLRRVSYYIVGTLYILYMLPRMYCLFIIIS